MDGQQSAQEETLGNAFEGPSCPQSPAGTPAGATLWTLAPMPGLVGMLVFCSTQEEVESGDPSGPCNC